MMKGLTGMARRGGLDRLVVCQPDGGERPSVP